MTTPASTYTNELAVHIRHIPPYFPRNLLYALLAGTPVYPIYSVPQSKSRHEVASRYAWLSLHTAATRICLSTTAVAGIHDTGSDYVKIPLGYQLLGYVDVVKTTPMERFKKGYSTPVGCRIIKIASFARDQLLGMQVKALLLRCIQDVCIEDEHVWTIVPYESSIKDFYQSAGFGHCHCGHTWKETDLGDEWAQLCTHAQFVDHWGIHRRMAAFVNVEIHKPEPSQGPSLTNPVARNARAQNTEFLLTNGNQVTTTAHDQPGQDDKVSVHTQERGNLRSTASGSLVPHYKNLPRMRIAEKRNQQLIALDISSSSHTDQKRSADTVQAGNIDPLVRDTFGHTAEDRKWLLQLYQTAESREQLQGTVQGLEDAQNYVEDMSVDKNGNSGNGSPLEVPIDLDGGSIIDRSSKTKAAGDDMGNGNKPDIQGSSGEEKKGDLPMDAASIEKRIIDRAIRELDRLLEK